MRLLRWCEIADLSDSPSKTDSSSATDNGAPIQSIASTISTFIGWTRRGASALQSSASPPPFPISPGLEPLAAKTAGSGSGLERSLCMADVVTPDGRMCVASPSGATKLETASVSADDAGAGYPVFDC